MARRSQSVRTTSCMYIIKILEFHVVVYSSRDTQSSYQNDSLEGQTHSEARRAFLCRRRQSTKERHL